MSENGQERERTDGDGCSKTQGRKCAVHALPRVEHVMPERRKKRLLHNMGAK